MGYKTLLKAQQMTELLQIIMVHGCTQSRHLNNDITGKETQAEHTSDISQGVLLLTQTLRRTQTYPSVRLHGSARYFLFSNTACLNPIHQRIDSTICAASSEGHQLKIIVHLKWEEGVYLYPLNICRLYQQSLSSTKCHCATAQLYSQVIP